MKKSATAKIFGVPAACLLVAGTLVSCSTAENPEDPGFNTPAVTGVLEGDITTWKGYGEALEKENRRASRDGPRWDDGLREDF